MGDWAGVGSHWEKPVHRVTVPPFWMGKYEVTFEEWDACTAEGVCIEADDEGWGRGRRPVINVSPNDIDGYIEWLNQKTGKRYRLPSEAEWEYAVRGGSQTRYWWGDTSSHEWANYGKEECCEGEVSGRDRWLNTSPVGSFPVNPYGLYDTAGNVREWTADCWHSNYQGCTS